MKNLLFVTETKGYLILSLKEKLQGSYNVITVSAKVDEISKIKEPLSAILIYGDEDLLAKRDSLTYLKDRAAEDDIAVFATGDADELKEIEGVFMSLLRGEFLRPLNVKELVDTMDNYIQKFGSDNKKKILVVDDSGAMLRNVKSWLEDHYTIVLANSGTMAIKYLALNRPDLVLLDYEMPVINGKQVLEMIRSEKEFEDIPVIFLTSKDDRQSVMEVMSLKPDGSLLKTMEPAMIIQTIDDFFERRKGQ